MYIIFEESSGGDEHIKKTFLNEPFVVKSFKKPSKCDNCDI